MNIPLTKNKFQVLFLIFILSFGSCKTQKVSELSVNKKQEIGFKAKKITKEIYNQDNTKLLILNYLLERSPIITFHYEVMDTKTQKELRKGVFVGTNMGWLDASTLKCTHHVGIVKKDRPPETVPENKNYSTIRINNL